MKKQFTEIRKTVLDIESKKIEGTPFVKWYGTQTEYIDNKKSVARDCGICTESCFENMTGVEFPKNGMLIGESNSSYGYFMAIKNEDMEAVMGCEKHITEVVKPIMTENIDSDDFDFYIFISATNQLMDLNFNFVSLPIQMDYVMTRLTNAEYDLDEALVKIKACPYVLFKDGVFITDIPYYNASDDEDLKIDFYILLPQDKYEKYRSFENSWDANDYILSEVIGISRNTKYIE